MIRALAAALALAIVSGLPPVRPARAEEPCADEPVGRILTKGGPEDLVALPMGPHQVRLFVRDGPRIGRADVRGLVVERMEPGWQPATGPFEPLGLSLVPGSRPGAGTLYVLDMVTPRRIWRLEIEDGLIRDPPEPWFQGTEADKDLEAGNDLQAVGDAVYVTRFDYSGFLPAQLGRWPGLVRVRGKSLTPYAEGLRGANGIVDLGPRGLLVSDYWNRRLRFVSKDPAQAGELPFATAELPVHPDNLTLEGDRVLIAGQRHAALSALNLAMPFVVSPSAVLEIGRDALGPEAHPRLLWDGGWSYGGAVSVAVPIPGGLALGQLSSPRVLIVHCVAPR